MYGKAAGWDRAVAPPRCPWRGDRPPARTPAPAPAAQPSAAGLMACLGARFTGAAAHRGRPAAWRHSSSARASAGRRLLSRRDERRRSCALSPRPVQQAAYSCITPASRRRLAPGAGAPPGGRRRRFRASLPEQYLPHSTRCATRRTPLVRAALPRPAPGCVRSICRWPSASWPRDPASPAAARCRRLADRPPCGALQPGPADEADAAYRAIEAGGAGVLQRIVPAACRSAR